MKRAGERQLADLISVGPAIRRDLEGLGVHTVAQLARRSPERLYRALCRRTGRRQDPCVLDTFRAAVAQACDPDLPVEQCVWWYWSRKRKENSQLSSGRASGTWAPRSRRRSRAAPTPAGRE